MISSNDHETDRFILHHLIATMQFIVNRALQLYPDRTGSIRYLLEQIKDMVDTLYIRTDDVPF